MSRIIHVDFLKFLGMYLVILGHCIQYFTPSSYVDNWIFRIIYSFHMPLFMFISGMFVSSSLKKPFKEVIIKKSRQLLFPILTWSIIIYILSPFLLLKSTGGVIGILMHNFWFLKSLWVCYVVFWSVHKSVICIILSCIIALFVPLWNINVMYPCFVIGFYYNKKQFQMQQSYFIIGLIFYLIVFLFKGNIIGYLRFYNIILNPILKIVMGISLSVVLIDIVRKFRNSNIIHLIGNMGKYTLPIYVLQVFLLEHFMAKYINIEHYSNIERDFTLIILSLGIYIGVLYLSYHISNSKLYKFLF